MLLKARLVAFSLSVAVGLSATPIDGASVSTSFSVSATVLAPACAASISPRSFRRSYERRGRSEVSVRCTQPTPYNISIDASHTDAVPISQRSLATSESSVIEYAFDESPLRDGKAVLVKTSRMQDAIDSDSVSYRRAEGQPTERDDATAGAIVLSVTY